MKYLENKNLPYIKIEGKFYYRYDPINKCSSTCPFYSSGIVNRPHCLNTLRTTFLNSSKRSNTFNFLLYDWTSGESVLIKSTDILLNPDQGKVIDIILNDCSINIELYEIRVTPYNNRLLINSYNI